MCTLGMPSRGVNSQPLTTGAQRGAIARTSAAASFGRRWPRTIRPSASLRLQHQRVAILALLVVLRVAEQHRVAFALRGVFNALEDQREEWIRDVRDGDEQLAGAQRAQVLGRGVRRVIEELDGLHHFAARIGRDDIRLAEDAGDGGGGDAGAFGDLVDVGHSVCSSYRTQNFGVGVALLRQMYEFCLDSPAARLYPSAV